jgi:hypothetical protein
MKKIFYPIFLLLLSLLAWTACDKIDEPLTLIGEEDFPENIDDTLFYVDSTLVSRKQVLLEDFTGHKCVNCPEWGIFAHELAAELDHKLIIISIHAGYYATPDASGDYTADLRTDAGTQLYEDFQIFANPTGLINRDEYNGSILVYPDYWEEAINTQLEKDPVATLSVKNKYFPNLNTVVIDLNAVALSDIEGKYKVAVYLTEDHVISPQKNNNPEVGPTPDWLDFEHMGLLRGAINTTYGAYISENGEMVTGEIYSREYIYKLNDDWVAANCNVIVYLYNEDTWEVVQVAELGIKTE